MADAVAGGLHFGEVDAEVARALADGGGGEDLCAMRHRGVRARSRAFGSGLQARPSTLGLSASLASGFGRHRRNCFFLRRGRPSAPSASGCSCFARRAARSAARRLRSRSRPAPSRSRSGRRLRRPASSPCPRPGDSISTVALSVIMSASCWSSSTLSPTLTCQATISASAMPSPMSGSLNLIDAHASMTFFSAFFMRIGPGK